LKTTGTLGVLMEAEELGLIDARFAYRRLKAETSFRSSSELEIQLFGHTL
jgi:predicted nucleic acid-binding protein